MVNLKLKFFILLVLILVFAGCKTHNNDLSSMEDDSTNKDYFLVFRGHDHNGALFTNFSIPYMKRFFNEVGWPFFMGYNVIPSIDEDPNQGYTEIIGNIRDISSKLHTDSTFIFFINAHGEKDGTCATGTEKLKTEDVINALKEGLNKNPSTKTFQRFIIMSAACYSGEFVRQFKEIKDSRNGSLFKEGVYIYSSDASEVTYGTDTWEILAPMFILLRELQVRRCNNTKEDNYDKIYKETLDSIKVDIQEIEYFRDKTESEKIYTKLNTNFENMKFSLIPTFDDIDVIINNINNIRFNRASMNIEFSDEFETETKGSIRNKAIFPDIESCK